MEWNHLMEEEAIYIFGLGFGVYNFCYQRILNNIIPTKQFYFLKKKKKKKQPKQCQKKKLFVGILYPLEHFLKNLGYVW